MGERAGGMLVESIWASDRCPPLADGVGDGGGGRGPTATYWKPMPMMKLRQLEGTQPLPWQLRGVPG